MAQKSGTKDLHRFLLRIESLTTLSYLHNLL